MKNQILFLLLLSSGLCFSQSTYIKTMDINFSGGNNGNFAGLDASDVVVTFNSTEGTMQVDVNKVKYDWSYLNIYSGSCWSKTLVFDQNNRYIEFKIKSSVAFTDAIINPNGGSDNGCNVSVGKTWPTAKFSITEDEVNQWKVVLVQIPPTTGGTQNIIDTIGRRLTWNLPNGSYTFDYVKIGEAAIPNQNPIEKIASKSIDIMVYPTIINSSVNIEFSETIKGNIDIIDLLGNIQICQPIKGNLNQVDLSELPSGIYLVRINDGVSSIYRKIMKQ